jgi:hypothetical protein
VANTLAYYDTATITAVKSFIVSATHGDTVFIFTNIFPHFGPGHNLVKLFTTVIYE